uniref:C-type lectin domain-containing protein n=1 Tax=Anolis carolinensis TaxID=28377 RepID=A0A803T3J2_ANOCA|nr:PREDICTED: C-type lectin domain family 2 member B [Anolis carolinensis]|eukprot:XP_008122147.1 PREDICTED: C-type lectin domain family 2 member B [Anolis carolinensis]
MVETPEGKKGWQPSCSLDPHAKENAIMDEIIKIEDSHLKEEYSRNETAWKSSLCLRKKKGTNAKCRLTWSLAIGSLTIIIIILIIILSVRRCGICPAPAPLLLCDVCPNGWIGFQRKCYYFSEAERNWTASSLHCSSHNASLAVIDSQEEMHFLLRYKSPPDHWIGLQRDNPEQPWRWINGTIFPKRLTIYGGGRCAYMISDAIASSSCSREEHWICSKPVESWYHVTV